MSRFSERQVAVSLLTIWSILLCATIALPEVVPLTSRGEFLIRNTVRLALLFWAIAALLMLTGNERSASSRLAWTLACLTYLIHVAMAFEYSHRWSHAAAIEHVRQVGGVGEGIFVNYLFTIVWTVDALWWWVDRRGYERRPRWLDWSIHTFMVFIIVNATVVFESGLIRWIGAAALIGLACLWVRRRPCDNQRRSIP